MRSARDHKNPSIVSVGMTWNWWHQKVLWDDVWGQTLGFGIAKKAGVQIMQEFGKHRLFDRMPFICALRRHMCTKRVDDKVSGLIQTTGKDL